VVHGREDLVVRSDRYLGAQVGAELADITYWIVRLVK
jgi:hypothetical protein